MATGCIYLVWDHICTILINFCDFTHYTKKTGLSHVFELCSIDLDVSAALQRPWSQAESRFVPMKRI